MPVGRALAALLLVAAAGLVGCAGSSGGKTPALASCSFWPPPPDEPRIQFLRSFRSIGDVEKEQSALEKIVLGSENRELPISKPYGVAAWRGRLYICDIANPGVVILDLVARQSRLMVARGVEQMVQPTDIAVADDGVKYVIDRRLGRIFVFDAEDRHVATYGERGLVPAGIAVHGDELFVPDFGTQSVLVLDRYRGTPLRSIGGPGGTDGLFVRPLGVAVAPDGSVYVADAIRGRLQRFAPDGALMNALGGISDAPGSFVRPKHVAVDADGIVYVVDAAFQNVQLFNDDGALLMYFGGAGLFPGAMSLPAGITIWEGDLGPLADDVHPAFEATRLIAVTNQFGTDKVSVYALGRLRPGRTVADIMPYAADMGPPPAPGRPVEPMVSDPEGDGAFAPE